MKNIEELQKLNNNQLVSEFATQCRKIERGKDNKTIHELEELARYKNDVWTLIIERMEK